MRVFLVDDHPLFRQALAATVAGIRANLVVEQFDTIQSVREGLRASDDARNGVDDHAALILLDLKLPDNIGMSGLLSIKADHPDVPVAVVSAHDDWETVQTAMACGAAGFVSKAAGLEELSAAIEALVEGESWFPGETGGDQALAINPTQRRILDGLHRGLMNKQIAWELGLSEHTIKYHLAGLFKKAGCQTRAQLLAATRDRFASSA